MGYTIIYDRQFVEVNGSYIPVFLSGANNVTTYGWSGREQSQKDWSNWIEAGKKALYTKEELTHFACTKWNEFEIAKRSRGSFFKKDELERYILNGMKYAQPIEFFIDRHVQFDIRVGTYEEQQYMRVSTSDELEAACVMASLAGKELHFEFTGREATWTKERATGYEVDQSLKSNEVYVLCEKGSKGYKRTFIAELIENGYRFSKDFNSALVFTTEQEKDAFMKQHKERLDRSKLVFVKMDKDKYKPVQGYYVLASPDNAYFWKRTGWRLYYCRGYNYAKKFKSEKLAKAYLEKYPTLVTKYNYKTEYVCQEAVVL